MNTIKVTVNLPTELIDKVRTESYINDTNMTTEIINGIKRGQFVRREASKGSKVLLEKTNGKLFKLYVY